MLGKLKPEHIKQALDKTLIARSNGVTLFYYHTLPRGYWMHIKGDEGIKFCDGRMPQACRKFNDQVTASFRGNGQ